jgi:hypothetical protein
MAALDDDFYLGGDDTLDEQKQFGANHCIEVHVWVSIKRVNR